MITRLDVLRAAPFAVADCAGRQIAEQRLQILNAHELTFLHSLSNETRRQQWLLGRYAAKMLVKAVLEESDYKVRHVADIVIAADGRGRPQLILPQEVESAPELMLSISHCGDRAAAAVCSKCEGSVGVDVERVRAFNGRFMRFCLTDGERLTIASAHPMLRNTLITACWSAKEAAIKALQLNGLHDARQIECVFSAGDGSSDSWTRFTATFSGKSIDGMWRLRSDAYVLAVAFAAAE